MLDSISEHDHKMTPMQTTSCDIIRQQVTLCGIFWCFFVTINSPTVPMPINIPTIEISKENSFSTGKKSDGWSSVREIIFAEIKIRGPLTNVQATKLLAIKSTSVS